VAQLNAKLKRPMFLLPFSVYLLTMGQYEFVFCTKTQLLAQDVQDIEDDELLGRRVHSWVLVRPGKRDVRAAFFIGTWVNTEIRRWMFTQSFRRAGYGHHACN